MPAASSPHSIPYSLIRLPAIERLGCRRRPPNRELARLLAQLGSPSIVQKVTQSLLARGDQEDRLQALFVLRNVTTGWTKETRQAYFTALNESASFIGGEGMPKFLAQVREDAIATLSERRAHRTGRSADASRRNRQRAPVQSPPRQTLDAR